ncbi:MAG: type II toxin-antitoxin system VapC family toxin [Acidobacteria bacterium]|nr:type II toxin-antitoxin system VapC family toxin [Acidobacteriota bacterium]MYG75183.1 type II toxin-antitoxin system VapC family toxin [Acidobacteriota bacterium]
MARLLLDTHALVWALSDVERLRESARAAIVDLRNDVFVSAVTAWEITVKRERGHLRAPPNLASAVEERRFTHLPLTFEHAEHAGTLPMHHRDPFDRFLIAQARMEGLILVTRDQRIQQYEVEVLPA